MLTSRTPLCRLLPRMLLLRLLRLWRRCTRLLVAAVLVLLAVLLPLLAAPVLQTAAV